MANPVNVYGGSVTVNHMTFIGNPEPQNQPPPGYENHGFVEEPIYPEHYEPMPEAQGYIDQQLYEPAPGEVYYIHQPPHEPEPTGPDPAYIELLQNILCRFPWPPPQWHNLALSENDVEFLRSICFADYTTAYHWVCHLAASSDYHRVNTKLRDNTGSGFWAGIRWRRRIHKQIRAQEAADPRIIMHPYEYTPVEWALLVATKWRGGVSRSLFDLFHSYTGLEGIWNDLWICAHANLSGDVGTEPMMGVDGREMHELESENGHGMEYSSPPPRRLDGAYTYSHS